jgi:hypothetical protein
MVCYEPFDLLEAIRESAPADRLWQYVILCLRGIGANQVAELVDRRRAGELDDQALNNYRFELFTQSQQTAGGGHSQGRKPRHLSAATQRAQAADAAFHPQWDVRRIAFPVTLHTRHILQREQCDWLRCLFANPFQPITFSPSWLTSTAVALATSIYDSRDFSAMPILADALQDAGCDNDDILTHCRQPGEHVRGCWVVDLILGKT